MKKDSKRAVMDSLVGKPFMLLPGNPGDHVVCAETHEGTKLRVRGVMTVFNDMLLMDAIEGEGFYRRTVSQPCLEHLEAAERLYGVNAADAVKHWLTLPNLKRAREWPGERPS